MESGGVRDIQDFDVDFNVDTKRDKVSIWTLEERSLPNLSKLYTYESQRLYLEDKIYEYEIKPGPIKRCFRTLVCRVKPIFGLL